VTRLAFFAAAVFIVAACSGSTPDSQDRAPITTGSPAVVSAQPPPSLRVPTTAPPEAVEVAIIGLDELESSTELAPTCAPISVFDYGLVNVGGRDLYEFSSPTIVDLISELRESVRYLGTARPTSWLVIEDFRPSSGDPALPYDASALALGYESRDAEPIVRILLNSNALGWGAMTLASCQ